MFFSLRILSSTRTVNSLCHHLESESCFYEKIGIYFYSEKIEKGLVPVLHVLLKNVRNIILNERDANLLSTNIGMYRLLVMNI